MATNENIRVVQLTDDNDNPVSPVVNVGSLYDKNGNKVDNLLSYKLAGTNVPVPEIKNVENELTQKVDAKLEEVSKAISNTITRTVTGDPINVGDIIDYNNTACFVDKRFKIGSTALDSVQLVNGSVLDCVQVKRNTFLVVYTTGSGSSVTRYIGVVKYNPDINTLQMVTSVKPSIAMVNCNITKSPNSDNRFVLDYHISGNASNRMVAVQVDNIDTEPTITIGSAYELLSRGKTTNNVFMVTDTIAAFVYNSSGLYVSTYKVFDENGPSAVSQIASGLSINTTGNMSGYSTMYYSAPINGLEFVTLWAYTPSSSNLQPCIDYCKLSATCDSIETKILASGVEPTIRTGNAAFSYGGIPDILNVGGAYYIPFTVSPTGSTKKVWVYKFEISGNSATLSIHNDNQTSMNYTAANVFGDEMIISADTKNDGSGVVRVYSKDMTTYTDYTTTSVNINTFRIDRGAEHPDSFIGINKSGFNYTAEAANNNMMVTEKTMHYVSSMAVALESGVAGDSIKISTGGIVSVNNPVQVKTNKPSAKMLPISDTVAMVVPKDLYETELCVTGEYTGNGKYGESNPVTINVGFIPTKLEVFAKDGATDTLLSIMHPRFSSGGVVLSNVPSNINIAVQGMHVTVDYTSNTVSFYHTGSDMLQLNSNSTVYRYIAWR